MLEYGNLTGQKLVNKHIQSSSVGEHVLLVIFDTKGRETSQFWAFFRLLSMLASNLALLLAIDSRRFSDPTVAVAGPKVDRCSG